MPVFVNRQNAQIVTIEPEQKPEPTPGGGSQKIGEFE